MNTAETERRRHERVPFSTRVRIQSGEERFESNAELRDISLKGLFVRTPVRLAIDSPCKVEIELSGTSSELRIRVTARVIRHGKDGMGIRFDALDIDSYLHLKNLLVHNATDPDRMEGAFRGNVAPLIDDDTEWTGPRS